MVSHSDDDIYFQCPNCPTTYDFTSFHDLDHLSRADPSEGPNALGQAQCRNCAVDFYYYLNSGGFPILIKNDTPTEVILGITEEKDKYEPVQALLAQSDNIDQRGPVKNDRSFLQSLRELRLLLRPR